MITLGIRCRLPEERISQRLNPVVKCIIEENPNHMKTKLKDYALMILTATIYLFNVFIIAKLLSIFYSKLPYYLQNDEIVQIFIFLTPMIVALIPFTIILYMISKIIDFISK